MHTHVRLALGSSRANMSKVWARNSPISRSNTHNTENHEGNSKNKIVIILIIIKLRIILEIVILIVISVVPSTVIRIIEVTVLLV